MGVAVKLKCSECNTVREAVLKKEDENIVCPACARTMKNLTEEDFAAIAAVEKKQTIFSIISILIFGGAVVVFKNYAQSGDATMFYIGVALALACVVLGGLASSRRYLVEF